VDARAHVFAEAKLQQECGQSDGGYDNEGQRAQERSAVGVDDHQRQGEQQ